MKEIEKLQEELSHLNTLLKVKSAELDAALHRNQELTKELVDEKNKHQGLIKDIHEIIGMQGKKT